MTDELRHRIYEQVMKENLDQDIVVVDDVHDVPCLNTEYHSRYFYIGMCRKGYNKGQYDYHDTIFQAEDICWIMPDHVLKHNYVSDDYTILSVFISKPFFLHLKKSGALGKFKYMARLSCISLSPDIFNVLYNAFKLLGSMDVLDNPKREGLMTSLMSIISNVCDHYIQTQYADKLGKQKLHEELYERFCDAIIEHHRESREVSFYARLLCRSPKYFASVIKQTTGVAASEWINHYIVIEAKWMLLHERQKSIQQIAHELGFSELASFSRFFKHIEGITPSEFRAKN